MRNASRLLALALVACGLVARPAAAEDLKVGDQAPEFAAPGTDGKTHDLNQLRGQWVVLAWFPKAFTGG